MNLPFTTGDFFTVLANYNNYFFPAQLVLLLAALFVLYSATAIYKNSSKLILAVLAAYWLWMGAAYHLLFFTSINKAAYGFGVIFILQSVIFAAIAFKKNAPVFQFRRDAASITGMVMVLYSILLYPLIGYLNGHTYPHSPTFGLPCPTTIFTFGILLSLRTKLPYAVLLIPVIWAAIGTMAAVNLTVAEDYGLIISAVIAIYFVTVKNRTLSSKGSLTHKPLFGNNNMISHT